MFKKFIKDAQKKAQEFLDKPETKEAMDKLKDEAQQVGKKVSKFLDEGDVILKKKVDEVLNKNKKTEEVVEDEVVVKETTVVKEEVVENPVEDQKEEVVEVTVVAKTEEVVVDTPVEEIKKEVVVEKTIDVPVTRKSSTIKVSEIGLSDKVVNSLIEEGVETFDQLEDMSDEEVLALNGIGKATLKKIREFKV